MKRYLRFSIYGSATIVFVVMWVRLVQEARIGQRILQQTAQLSASKPQSDDMTLTEEQIQRYLKRARRENEMRQWQIKRVCEKYNLGIYRNRNISSLVKHPKTPLYDVFFIDTLNKIAWCPIRFAAFETWLQYFGILGGFSEQELNSSPRLVEVLRQRYPRGEHYEIEEALQNSLKFIIVRHPFERLISMYRDSWINGRPNDSLSTEANDNKGGKSRKSATLIAPEVKLNDDRLLNVGGAEHDARGSSFKDFVSYILEMDFTSSTQLNEYWTPYYMTCTPCLLKYQIIAKLETLNEDQLYIIRAAGLQNSIKTKWKHSFSGTNSSRVSEDAKRFFPQLSKFRVLELFQKYKLDFELFDYGHKEYVKLAQ